MSLEMRVGCERCGAALAQDGVAFICSYECTFCEVCATSMGYLCRNYGGELRRRPGREEEGP